MRANQGWWSQILDQSISLVCSQRKPLFWQDSYVRIHDRPKWITKHYRGHINIIYKTEIISVHDVNVYYQDTVVTMNGKRSMAQKLSCRLYILHRNRILRTILTLNWIHEPHTKHTMHTIYTIYKKHTIHTTNTIHAIHTIHTIHTWCFTWTSMPCFQDVMQWRYQSRPVCIECLLSI